MAYEYFADVSTMGRKNNEQILSANCALISEVNLHVKRCEVQCKAPQNKAVHVSTGAASREAKEANRCNHRLTSMVRRSSVYPVSMETPPEVPSRKKTVNLCSSTEQKQAQAKRTWKPTSKSEGSCHTLGKPSEYGRAADDTTFCI